MMTPEGSFAALAFEISARDAAGLATPWQARELVAQEIEAAAAAGDGAWLWCVWRDLPATLSEAADLLAAGRELPI